MMLLFTVFIPGKLVNPQASSRGGTWHKHARLAKSIRERTAQYLFWRAPRIACPASRPKLVQFTAYVWNLYDDDNLRTALKPYRDALKDMRVIDDDRDSAGHTFLYYQKIRRNDPAQPVGVEITVETHT